MGKVGSRANGKLAARRLKLEAEWRRLCNVYLPVRPPDTAWRFSRPMSKTDPEQGWKLHVSATVLTAGRIFRNVAPLLRRAGVLFKAPGSLEELQKLNCGLFYGFSQVGKFVTVYPRDAAEAVALARTLHGLVRNHVAPAVPYGLPY